MPASRATRRPGTGSAPTSEENVMTDVATPEQTAPAAEVSANGATAELTDGAAPAEATKKTTAPIQLTVPLDLKATIDAKAEAAGKSSARWILENIAGDLTYTLPEPTRAAGNRGGIKMTDVFGKDLTAEQKKSRLTDAKTLLDALSKGLVNLDDIRAKLGVA